MLVMHESVSLEYALEGRSMRTEEVPSVHQLPVYLVLDKGHQNARKNEPATNLQNKHQRFLHSKTPLPNRHSRSEEHTSELQSHHDLVCRLLLEKKKKKKIKSR